MPPINDTENYLIAQSNCAYCSVGATFNKPASSVMRTVIAALGLSKPELPDIELGFSRFYEKKQGLQPDDTKSLDRQIKGIVLFYRFCGIKTKVYGGGKKGITQSEFEKIITSLHKGTEFLCCIGDYEEGFQCISQAHWINGKKTENSVEYTDNQIYVTSTVKNYLSKKYKNVKFGSPLTCGEPVRAFGEKIEETDRIILIVIEGKAERMGAWVA